MLKFERKLQKFWAQSFLLGVPKIIVGFRTRAGILHHIEELETKSIPGQVKRNHRATWDGNRCINFTAAFLECRAMSTCFAQLGDLLINYRAKDGYNVGGHLACLSQGTITGHRSFFSGGIGTREDFV